MAIIVNNDTIMNMRSENTIGPQTEDNSRLQNGDFTFIIGHPEFLTDGLISRQVVKPHSRTFTHIVVDEAHCLLLWGKSDFRPAFLRIATLRSIAVEAKCLALTATAKSSDRFEISRLLRMRSPTIVALSPDRRNVFLEVVQRPPSSAPEDSYDWILKPVIGELIQKGPDTTKTIVFVNRLKWCGYSYFTCAHDLVSDVVADGLVDMASSRSELIEQYHSPQNSDAKLKVAESFVGGKCRVLFATDAFGMGVDVPDIRKIIHAGPPHCLEAYAQQIGRCGRDGKPARATLYYNNTDLRSNLEEMDQSIRDYCRTSECRRSVLLKYFGFEIPNVSLEEQCCDNCLLKAEDVLALDEDATPNHGVTRLLKNYFDELNGELGALTSVRLGLSPSLAAHIGEHSDRYEVAPLVLSSFPWLDVPIAEGIAKICLEK